MNPLTNVKNIQRMNQRELELGLSGKNSWHNQYKDSAWIFVGGLDFELTEGDIICVFSQYGEVVCINLIRDHKTGKSKGFAFLCYENQQSTILAVDNLNGIKIVGRIIRVDHVEEYKVPKMREDMDPERMKLLIDGCAPKPVLNKPSSDEEVLPIVKQEDNYKGHSSRKKKKKKSKKKRSSSLSDSDSSDTDYERKRKKKKSHR